MNTKIVSLAFAICSYGIFAHAENITIEKCYELARENYPAIKQFDLIKRSENFTLENANTKYYPQLSASANAMYLSHSPEINGVRMVPQDLYQMQITATQVIWDGGEISSSKKITRAQAAVELENNETLLYALKGRVNQLYFGILLQLEALKQNEILQDDISVAIAQIKSKIANGTANDYDLSMLEVELLNAEQDKISTESAMKAYLEILSIFVGVEINSAESLVLPKSESERKTFINRPELRYYDARAELHNARKDAVDAGLMPRISLFGAAGYGRPNFDLQDSKLDFYGLVGIRFSISFGDYYTEKNEKLKIMEDKKAVQVERETFIFNTRLDMANQEENIRKYEKLIEGDDRITALRDSIKRASFERLKNGVINTRDYLKDVNAHNLAVQSQIYRKMQKLSSEYEYKFITNSL